PLRPVDLRSNVVVVAKGDAVLECATFEDGAVDADSEVAGRRDSQYVHDSGIEASISPDRLRCLPVRCREDADTDGVPSLTSPAQPEVFHEGLHARRTDSSGVRFEPGSSIERIRQIEIGRDVEPSERKAVHVLELVVRRAERIVVVTERRAAEPNWRLSRSRDATDGYEKDRKDCFVD